MIRLGKLTDYGLVLMMRVAGDASRRPHSAADLARETELPLPTVTKLLKELLNAGLLTSCRGANGGYSLARDARDISVAEIISALEGEIALTECDGEIHGQCTLEPCCPVKSNLHVIGRAVREALEGVALSDLLRPIDLVTLRGARPLASGGDLRRAI